MEKNNNKLKEELNDEIIAYALDSKFSFDPEHEYAIKPAPIKRKWMEETGWYDHEGKWHAPHAYKCLPLVIANQMGWILTCPVGFTATWDGTNKASQGAVRFEFDEEPERWSSQIIDRFGVGTFTFPVPYVFRTPPNVQLLTRGPTNSWKTNCQSLDAVMESDWLPYPFFQTWKIKRPNEPVRFNKGEPYAMIHPVSVGEIKEWDFYVRSITENEELNKEYVDWAQARTEFQSNLSQYGAEWAKENGDWQKDYSRGKFRDGSKAENHYPSLGKREVKCPFARLWRTDNDDS